MSRRTLLHGGLAAAAACGLSACARPAPAATPLTFIVTANMYTGPAGDTATQGAIFQPVLTAFNRTHPGMRASYGPGGVHPKAVRGGITAARNPNPACVVDGYPGVQPAMDLGPVMHTTNFEASGLLPGLLAAVQGPGGIVYGMPVDVGPCALSWDPAALAAAGVALPPRGGWTEAQLLEAVAQLGRRLPRERAFGWGLATSLVGLGGPVWLGFAEGYGGTVFGSDGTVTLSSGRGYEGLEAYAAILAHTWVGQGRGGGALGFASLLGWFGPTAPHGPTVSASGAVGRFPLMPVVPAIRAQVRVAWVPSPPAPGAEGGAEFAVWLATPPGQAAMTAIDYPSVRVGGTAPRSWMEEALPTVEPAQLRFRPGVLASAAAESSLAFDDRLTAALALPQPRRLSALQALERAASGLLSGVLSLAQAADSLNRAVVPRAPFP